ncbi:MAG: UDP-GlcNAc--UDP-phosphate GlcNAc-1-phosphate transferase [Bacteroidetes bacterium]|nr:MAG: UDP-GlcNAc--UDP-phosphate GlcNAc-1-phosphate transferase [Bacteroidota bacterium]
MKLEYLIYPAIFIILVGVMQLYMYIAKRFDITDEPGYRSNHQHTVLRGGGILFPIVVLLFFAIHGPLHPYFFAGVFMLSVVSFWDDVMNVKAVYRLMVQIAAVGLMLLDLHVANLGWPILLLMFVVGVGWVNAFNFMDGINGITAINASLNLATLVLINYEMRFIEMRLLIFLLLSVIVFGIYNFRRRALVFAGDIGSITMAYSTAFAMGALILYTGQWQYLLFLSVYAVDAGYSVLHRVFHGFNPLKPHRTFLFHMLVNEVGWPHLAVSSLYAGLQLLINLLTYYVIIPANHTNAWSLLLLAVLTIAYWLIKSYLRKTARRKGTLWREEHEKVFSRTKT